MKLLHDLQSELAQLNSESRLRKRRTLQSACAPEVQVDGRTLINFAANDYLGLANHPQLIAAAQQAAQQWGVGAGASHLVSGHFEVHAEMEQALARFVAMPAALGFTTGYMANLGIVTALTNRGDVVFADKLNHASLIDAQQLCRAEVKRYPHKDLDALTRLLADTPARNRFIVTDAVFSMDGDLAPLAELLALAKQYDALLIVDDAHGFGVLGPQGRGSLAHLGLQDERILYMGTLGKAAGVHGAFVAGHETLIQYLLQTARSGIFTTAAPPMLAACVLACLPLIEQGDALRAQLRSHIAALRKGLSVSAGAETRTTPITTTTAQWQLLPSDTAIQPIVLGDNAEAVRVANALWERGIWAPAIRPPTVPVGTARLRVSLSAAHSAAHVQQLIDALRELQ